VQIGPRRFEKHDFIFDSFQTSLFKMHCFAVRGRVLVLIGRGGGNCKSDISKSLKSANAGVPLGERELEKLGI